MKLANNQSEIIEYFTSKGVRQVVEKYRAEIGNYFYFDSSETKYKLEEITDQPAAGQGDCFNIKFNAFSADKPLSLTIHKFMSLNSLDYNFHDFDTKTI